MVSSIVLGNFFNFGGKNVLTGGNTGLDIETLVGGLVTAKLQPVVKIQDQITKNDKVVSALGQFQSLLASFKSAANSLRNPPGVGNEADNAFAYNSVSVTGDNGEVSISASPGVVAQSFTISYIQTLAKPTKQSSDVFSVASASTTGVVVASGATGAQFNAGTFTFEGADITLTESDTLDSIAQKFNLVANQTLVNASVLKLSDNQYVLTFTGIIPGSDNAFDLDSPTSVTSDPSGVLSSLNFTDNQIATDAVFMLDGQEVTRSKNVIDDAIEGVTIALLDTIDEDPLNPPADPTIITATIESDTQTAQGGIVAFLEAYNNIREFIAQQTELNDDGTYADTAILANNSLFRNTVNMIMSEISAAVAGITDEDADEVTDIGIKFVDLPESGGNPSIKNSVTVEETKFAAALAANFDGVRKLFEFDFNSTSTNLKAFTRTNSLEINEFTLDINPFATQVISGLDVADANTAFVVATADDPGELGAGPITINGQTITLTAGMTLNQVANAFNTVSATTGLSVAVTGSAGDFTLTFTAERKAGKSNLFSLASTTQDASNAVFGQLEIDVTGIFRARYEDESGMQTISLTGTALASGAGYKLTGQDDTVLEGLVMVFGAQAAEEPDVTVTQGIADRMWNVLDGVLNSDDGTLLAEYTSIQERKDNYQDQIDKIEAQVAKYQTQLLSIFGALENAVSKVNQLLNILDANQKAKELAS